MRAEEEAKEVATTAFLNVPAHRRRRRKLGRSSLESSASGLSDSKEVDSSNNSSKGSFDGSDSRDDEGKEEEVSGSRDDSRDDSRYLAPDYPQEYSRDDTDAYVSRSP